LQKNRIYAIHFLLTERADSGAADGEREWTGTGATFHIQPEARVTPQGVFFIWIRRNPLKRPESAKGIQRNARTFPWIYLDFLAFPCMRVAFRL
jgi:hypothetical protein